MPHDSSGSTAGNPIPFAHPDALSDLEKLLAIYFVSSAVGLGILDAGFRYLAVNDTLAKMNGVPAADHLGKTAREILGDLADRVEPDFRRVLSSGNR